MIKRVHPNGKGIPWMVILDAGGKPLANSTGPDGNIGYPSEKTSIVHFEAMLRGSRQNLTAEEIQVLIAALLKDTDK